MILVTPLGSRSASFGGGHELFRLRGSHFCGADWHSSRLRKRAVRKENFMVMFCSILFCSSSKGESKLADGIFKRQKQAKDEEFS